MFFMVAVSKEVHDVFLVLVTNFSLVNNTGR